MRRHYYKRVPKPEPETTFLYIKRILRKTELATLYEVEVPPEGTLMDDETRQLWIPNKLVIEDYYEADKSIAIPVWFYNQLIDEGKL